METILAIITGLLFAVSTYLLQQRHILRVFFGLVLLSNAVNVVIFTMGRLGSSASPLIPEGETVLLAPSANPLPQALILTAIVIGFGLLAFMLVLIFRTEKALQTVDTNEMAEAELNEESAEEAAS